jgi:hypothetical protein
MYVNIKVDNEQEYNITDKHICNLSIIQLIIRQAGNHHTMGKAFSQPALVINM